MPRKLRTKFALLATLLAVGQWASAQDIEFWAKSVTVTTIDKQREDLPFPEWLDTQALIGPPNGSFTRLVIHNGWNDFGDITIDLGTEVPWGELVLVHRQEGPGAAKSTIVYVAPEDGEFSQFGRAPITDSLTTTVLPCDTPIRYIRIAAGAGGAVPVDSTWYFDAVGVRTGRAAVTRAETLEEHAKALAEQFAQVPPAPALNDLIASGRARAQEQLDSIAALDKLAIQDIPGALERIRAALDQLDALAMRLGAVDLFPNANNGNPPAYMATWMPGMAKVRPADPVRAANLRANGSLALARHEYESIQLVLVAGDEALQHVQFVLEPLKRDSSEDTIAPEHIRLDRINLVRVDGELWPDPILPLGDLTIPAGGVQAFRLQVYAPPDTPPGRYHTTVRVNPANLHALSLPLDVQVYDFQMPVIAHTKHIIGCGAGGIEPLLFANRTPTGGGPAVGAIAEPRYILRKDGTIAMDFTDYDLVMAKAFDAGLSAFGLPLSAGDGGGYMPARMTHTFFNEATGADEALLLDPLKSDLTRQRLTDWLQLFTTHLREKGWFERAIFYLWDEPNVQYTDTLLAVGRAVKAAVPDLPILIVESPNPAWHEVADIYCPQVKWFGRPSIEKELAELHALGKQMWWYNCGDPAPFPTYAIPHDAACARMSFLLMWKYHLTGNLYWAAGAKGLTAEGTAENPGADGRGDGQLAYSATSAGIVPSLRLEMIRDGVEDYEYLWLLNDLVNRAKQQGKDVAPYEALLAIPSEVAVDASHYTRDPSVIETYRAALAKAIEELSRVR